MLKMIAPLVFSGLVLFIVSCSAGAPLKELSGQSTTPSFQNPSSADSTYGTTATPPSVVPSPSVTIPIPSPPVVVFPTPSPAPVSTPDIVSPPRLAGLQAQAGSIVGDIALTWSFPPDVSDYSRIIILRNAGNVAPDFRCNVNGVVVAEVLSTATTGLIDHTGSINGEAYSYRICIFDGSNNLTSVDEVSGVHVLDILNPVALTTFTAQTGALARTVKLDLTYPLDTTDYDRVELRRLQGTSPPSPNCNNGAIVFSGQGPFVSGEVVDDTGVDSGVDFSYRICIWDRSANLTSTNVVSGVKARIGCGGAQVGGYCWYLGSVGQSCVTACTSHGATGVSDGTLNFAGAYGTAGQCQSVMDALGAAGGSASLAFGTNLGCSLNTLNNYRYWWIYIPILTPPTDINATNSNVRRACSCTF